MPRDWIPDRPGGRCFFTRFNFTISYHPGPKNVRADALSPVSIPQKRSVRNQKPSFQRKSSSAPSSEIPSQTPPPMSPHLLCRAAHQVCNTSPEHDALHSFTLCTHLWALATLEPTALSRCWRIASGGPIWPGMWEGLSKAARTVPFTRAHAICHRANSSRCLFPTVPGHT